MLGFCTDNELERLVCVEGNIASTRFRFDLPGTPSIKPLSLYQRTIVVLLTIKKLYLSKKNGRSIANGTRCP